MSRFCVQKYKIILKHKNVRRKKMEMLKLWVSAVAILTRVSARKGQGRIVARREEDGRLCDDFCSVLVVNVLTRHALAP